MSIHNNVLFTAGGCNDDPLNLNCFCFGLQSSNDLKIFTPSTRDFKCCGVVGLNATKNYPNALGTNDVTQNTILNFALLSDPECMGWFNGSSGNFPSSYTALHPLPIPGQDWYLPDSDGNTNGLMPSAYGPTTQQIQLWMNQSYINEVIYLPTSVIGGGSNSSTSTTMQCPSDPSKNIGAYWMRYLNPNYRSVNYNVALVCADLDVVQASQAYTSSDFALFNAPTCAPSSTPGSFSCIKNVGEVTNFSEATLGSLLLTSKGYNGGFPPFPGSTSSSGGTSYLWLIILLLCLIVVAVVITIVFIVKGYEARKSPPPSRKSSTTVKQ